MAGCEAVVVVPALSELARSVVVGEHLGILVRVTERLATTHIVEWYKEFRNLSRGWGGRGGWWVPFFTLPRGRRAGSWQRWGGPVCGVRCLGEDRGGG